MDVAAVRQWVAQIESAMDDDERAHTMEDDLRERVLEAIANGEVTDIHAAREMAQEALKTGDLDFARWCA